LPPCDAANRERLERSDVHVVVDADATNDGEKRGQLRIRILVYGGAEPQLDERAADRLVQDPDGAAELLRELLREQPRDGSRMAAPAPLVEGPNLRMRDELLGLHMDDDHVRLSA